MTGVTLFHESVHELLLNAENPCYIRAMKKLVAQGLALGLLSIAIAVPAMAVKYKNNHPKPVHPENPYLKHPNHKMHRGRHKKI